MSKSILCVLLLLAVSGSVSAADVHRWVDEQGKVHYGERPPPGVKESAKVHVDPPATDVAAERAAAAVNRDAPPGAEVEAQALAAEQQSLKTQRCQSARELLKKYDEARYMLTKDADGTQRRATIEEEAAERLRVRREIDTNCGG